MGLGGNLNDGVSESFPLLLLIILASSLAHLRAAVMELLGLSEMVREEYIVTEAAAAEELAEMVDSVHKAYEYEGEGEGRRVRCVVCMSRVRRGELVRRLGCDHIFHRRCLDGWVGRRNVGCPLCRKPMVAGGEVGGGWDQPVTVGPAFFD